MLKDVNVIYRIHETIIILISLKRYFSYLNKYLTKVVFNVKEIFLFLVLDMLILHHKLSSQVDKVS